MHCTQNGTEGNAASVRLTTCIQQIVMIHKIMLANAHRPVLLQGSVFGTPNRQQLSLYSVPHTTHIVAFC